MIGSTNKNQPKIGVNITKSITTKPRQSGMHSIYNIRYNNPLKNSFIILILLLLVFRE